MSALVAEECGGDSVPQSDRLEILTPEEYEFLWGFPRFTQSDRGLFFALTAPEPEALAQCRSIRTKLHFLLHLGYFRARQRFFRFELAAVHSTDTHGTNQVNFALLHQFGYRFAPRYRNVQRQVKRGLVGFRHPTRYDKDWAIRPNRRVREGLILSEETNIELSTEEVSRLYAGG